MEKRQSRIQPKRIVITRSSKHTFVTGGNKTSMGMPYDPRPTLSMNTGVAGNIAHRGVDDMKMRREEERKQMQDLNDRFANYVSQVRSLEAENKALREQLKKKKKEFDPEPLKEIYQAEIDESKKLLEEANKENAALKVHIATIEDELEDQRSM